MKGIEYGIYILGEGWYSGRTYAFQGQQYPCVKNEVQERRTWKTRKMAERAMKTLRKKIQKDLYEIEVREI